MSSVVFSVRIDRRLKELMDSLRDVDWAEEVRRFLEYRVREVLKSRLLAEADKIREELLHKYGTFRSSAELIREDREDVTHRCRARG